MRKIIDAEKLYDEKVVIESTINFEESAFNNVYRKAELLLEKIILQNIDSRRKDEECLSTRQSTVNLVAFDGRRGTGKTSVMLSVAEALREYPRGCFLENINKKTSVSFTVLDYIDASLMEENEDVMEIILANMFSKLRQCNDSQNVGMDFELHELYSLFDDVYGNILNFHSDEKKREMSPMRVLTNLSNSQTLEKTIQELVAKYLKFMARTKNPYATEENSFLVISIDDLDMRLVDSKHSSPYHLLETLHRYLMIPGVIILLTYNYKDLYLSCVNHFYELYKNTLTLFIQDPKKHVLELVTQYLNKVIPIYARVHMPSLRKKDYTQFDTLLIKLDRSTANEIMGNDCGYLWMGDDEFPITISVKRFVLLLKAFVAGLYYDACGNKRHFAEPKDLRELTQTVTFYKQLNRINQQNKEDAVFKELLDDLYYRIAEEKLDWKEQEKLNAFLDVPIERRSKDIVEDIREEFKRAGINNISKITNAEISYSYGELLYFLYQASSKKIYSKSFICCILDSYTIMLTRTYRKMIQAAAERNLSDYNRYKTCILDVIGFSVASSWCNEYIPKVQIRELIDSEKNDYTVSLLKGPVAVGAVRFDEFKLITWEYDLRDNVEIETAEIQLRMLECLCMLFTDVFYREEVTGQMYRVQVAYQSPDTSTHVKAGADIQGPHLTISFQGGCFNIMNFVRNLFEGDCFFDNLHDSLLEPYKKYLNDLEKARKTNREFDDDATREFFKRHSLKKEWENWKRETDGLAMPVYSFDMMYNVLKRLYKNQKEMPTVIDHSNYWYYVKAVYKGVGELLRKEDEFYYSPANGKMQETKYHFYKLYMECPFIKFAFHMIPEEEKMFGRQFGKLALSFANILVNGGVLPDDLSTI